MDPYSAQMIVMNQIGKLSDVFIGQVRALLFATALFIVGLLASEVAKYTVTALLKVLRWDGWCQRLGLTRLLHKSRPELTPSVAAGRFTFWVVLLTFFMKALAQTELPWVADLGRVYFDALPRALEGAAWFVAYAVAAHWLGRLVLAVYDHAGALLAAGLGQALILNLGLFVVLRRLGLEATLAQPVILILLGASTFAVALAWALNRGRLFRTVVRVTEAESGE